MRDDIPDVSALRFLVGRALKSARSEARPPITQAQAAGAIGVTSGKLSYMESGATAQSADHVAVLMRLYKAPAEDVEWVVSLAVRADHGVLSTRNDDVWPDWFRLFVGLEQLAERSFVYANSLLPGQLQTLAYATAVLDGSLHIPARDVGRVAQARIDRQRLTADMPLELTAVIEECVLDRPIGGPAVMAEQLEHVLDLLTLPNVDVRVIPTSVGYHDGLGNSFTELNFAEARGIAYVEYHTGAVYLQERSDINLYTLTASRLMDTALSPDETVDVVRSRIAKI
ncbi:helix-turn-helix transcriptional regulator [Nocardia sp. CS682]|uniref:helix-turn-helix domain-containing protein n=1 Tax=Nocardia sp. CS682 TaxID=1047172 RepID=UPI0010750CA2|nr:helix-turn-helix transcriptional regulator [Nocardia sp. CS682]QBS41317.1 XRE family transcriptional regulator [Nocardia sp. CS682]